MGMIAYIYRAAESWDCTNGGMSSRVNYMCLTNVPGPFNPSHTHPAAQLLPGHVSNSARIVFDDPESRGREPMFGGNYAATSDSRFSEAVKKLTGANISIVPIHDRFETN